MLGCLTVVAGQNDPTDIVAGPALEAAPRLLGLWLDVRSGSGRIVGGSVVEVEAYSGADDPASHAYRGPTPRAEVMFGPPGRLYVYRSYGIHWCANVVCGPEGTAGAVLIRALEPRLGVEHMWSRRPKARVETDLCSGPGKLCAALGIGGDHNGVDLLDLESPVRLRSPDGGEASGAEMVDDAGGTRLEVVTGPRIGISRAVDRPWRFGLAENPHLSRPFPAR